MLRALVGFAMFGGPILTGNIAHAQAVASSSVPSFEVASIKANHSGERIMLFQPGRGGRFTANNCSLGLLMQYAFDVLQYQILGAPAWVKSDRYDIAAKAEGDPQVDVLRGMVQRLLEDWFQLKHHWETKEATVYDLVVSKAGRLREAEGGECPPADDAPCGGLRNTPGHSKGYKLTAGDLAGSISFFLGRPVRDKTGLTGKYDVELLWTPDSVQMGPETMEAGPALFTALQEQLGLKLKLVQGPVKMLAIDCVERPSEN
jgi:uncharacterized protein (TIGR03435 family)